MSTDVPAPQPSEPTPAESSNSVATTPQINGSAGDVEMDGTHETKEDVKEQDKEGEKEKESAGAEDLEREKEKDQDQTEEDLTKLFTARREEEMARRDRSLAEFLVMLDGYKPLVSVLTHRVIRTPVFTIVLHSVPHVR